MNLDRTWVSNYAPAPGKSSYNNFLDVYASVATIFSINIFNTYSQFCGFTKAAFVCKSFFLKSQLTMDRRIGINSWKPRRVHGGIVI